MSEDLEDRYQQAYDESVSVNPFDKFQECEKQRKVSSLDLADRLLVSVGQLLFSNRYLRKMTLLYLVALHVLVLFFFVFLGF